MFASKSSGALEVRFRRVDVEEAQRYGALELWRCVAGVVPLSGMETGAREACWGPGDVEVFASRAPDRWRCDAGV